MKMLYSSCSSSSVHCLQDNLQPEQEQGTTKCGCHSDDDDDHHHQKSSMVPGSWSTHEDQDLWSTEHCSCPPLSSFEAHAYTDDFRQTKENHGSAMRCYCCKKSVQQFFILFLLSGLSLIPGVVRGLQCYECLSLACDSRQICESIKDTINSTFVRNSHYIHFDPKILCPGPNLPTNSSEWTEVVYNCTRSDSVCLEAPIEVISSFDGQREGKRLEPGKTVSSWGFVRGCASRRGLGELPRSISVRKITMGNETLKYKSNDDFKIERILYHEIYVDHGTENATKCYTDECNNRRKHRVRSAGESNIIISNQGHMISQLLLVLSSFCLSGYFQLFQKLL